MENNLSETAFTIPGEDGEADYELRWFTPTLEVVLCGHATLASGHVLIGDARAHPLPHPPRRHARGGARRRRLCHVAAGLKPDPKPLPRSSRRSAARRSRRSGIRGRYALIVVDSEAEVRALQPDFRALAAERRHHSPSSPRPGDDDRRRQPRLRPGAGIDEDPVTGSAHAVLVPYWAERLGRTDAMTFYQASKRGGHLTGRLDGDRVILGGKCVTVIEGVMRI